MNVFRPILVLLLVPSLFTNAILGQKSWCMNHFEGFSLPEDYNRNSPPMPPTKTGILKTFVLDTRNQLWDVNEKCSVTETFTSSTHGERIKLKISGDFKYRSTLFQPNRKERRHELQYSIEPPPRLSNMSSVTFMNTTIPVFSWEIHLKRLIPPYIVKTFVPMITLVMTSWISFLIPPESFPGRFGLLVTLLLVLTTFHLHELDQSPLISSVTPLLLWSEICLAFVLIAFLQYSCILYFMRFYKEMKIKNKGRNGIDPTYNLGKQRETRKSNRNGKSNKNMGDALNGTWQTGDVVISKDVLSDMKTAMIIDYYALTIIPLGFILVLFVYFIHFSA